MRQSSSKEEKLQVVGFTGQKNFHQWSNDQISGRGFWRRGAGKPGVVESHLQTGNKIQSSLHPQILLIPLLSPVPLGTMEHNKDAVWIKDFLYFLLLILFLCDRHHISITLSFFFHTQEYFWLYISFVLNGERIDVILHCPSVNQIPKVIEVSCLLDSPFLGTINTVEISTCS